MKMSEDERQCLSESRGGGGGGGGGLLMTSFLFLVIARVAIWWVNSETLVLYVMSISQTQ